MAAELVSVLQLRIATLLNSSSLQKKFSMRCRHLQTSQSISSGAVRLALLQTLALSVGMGFEHGSGRVMSDSKGRHFEG